MIFCMVEGCERKSSKRKMCDKHYRQWYRSQPGNLEKEREQERKRNADNPFPRRNRSKKYYNNNKEKEAERHAAYMRTGKGRFVTAKINAKAAGHDWEILFDEYELLLSKPCYYCGLDLHETGSALDRLDNNDGYKINNVVTCCSSCNMLRGNRLTPEETKVLALVLRSMREEMPLLHYLTGTGVTWVHTTSAP